MTQHKHTPTPWRTEAGGLFIEPDLPLSSQMINLAQCSSSVLTLSQNKANAAFIVRAVNSHEQLIKLLHSTLEFLESEGHRDSGLFQSIDQYLLEVTKNG